MSTCHDLDKHRRHSLRLQGYDYTQEGAYFVTVCMRNRACLFGDISDGKMILNDAVRPAEKCWKDIPAHFPDIELDEFVIMPNHVHGILSITAAVGAKKFSPLHSQQMHGPSKTIGSVIRGFKVGVTKWMRHNTPVYNVWQRNYYEHVIRNEDDLNRIRQYIMENPSRWAEDEENPAHSVP
jgi:putative transposase